MKSVAGLGKATTVAMYVTRTPYSVFTNVVTTKRALSRRRGFWQLAGILRPRTEYIQYREVSADRNGVRRYRQSIKYVGAIALLVHRFQGQERSAHQVV